MQCGCLSLLQITGIEEWPSGSIFARFYCKHCKFSVGIEGEVQELDTLVPTPIWTDEALYQLSRLPPYLGSLVWEEVDTFATDKQQKIVTYSRFLSARNKGMVEWLPEASRRLENVPPGIRAMAKVELERTAVERGMPKVTVELMEEVKTRYFGMAGRS